MFGKMREPSREVSSRPVRNFIFARTVPGGTGFCEKRPGAVTNTLCHLLRTWKLCFIV